MKKRRPYPTDVSDEEWYFAVPYLTLMNKDAPQRRYELREMFNALRRLARDYEPLPETLAGLHFVVFSVLTLVHFANLTQSS
jgi:hypothetical protein